MTDAGPDAVRPGQASEPGLRLTVITPLALVLDQAGVEHVRAEDATGSFGILRGHTDFLTVLPLSVVIYRLQPARPEDASREHFIGLRGGVLSVTGGWHVQVFAREALPSDDLLALSRAMKEHMAVSAAREAAAQRGLSRLEGALLSHMTDLLRLEHSGDTSTAGSRT